MGGAEVQHHAIDVSRKNTACDELLVVKLADRKKNRNAAAGRVDPDPQR